jgi:hypothetical protein
LVAAPVLDDAKRRFGDYALDYVFIHRRMHPVTAQDMAHLSQIVRDIEDLLVQLAPFTADDDPELPELLEKARALKASIVPILAVAGLDTSWAQGEHETISLTQRESIDMVQALLDPPEPNDALRQAFKDYKAIIGL